MKVPVWIIALVMGVGLGGPVSAADVLGYEVEPVSYRYIVTSTVNVREKPQTNAKRLDRLPEGATPEVIGRYRGWFAIARDGQPFGFVYGSVMFPTVSGALVEPLTGRVVASARSACDYVINHVSSDPIAGEIFGTSDYDVRLTCVTPDDILRVSLPMFLVEGPLGSPKNPVFQISLDVPEIVGGYDSVLSAIMLYRAEDDVVRFDALSIDGYGRLPDPRERPATTVQEALVVALELAVTAWNNKVWSVLTDIAD